MARSKKNIDPSGITPFGNLKVLLITLLGSLLVFSWVILMNRYVTRPDRGTQTTSINFTVPEVESKPAPPPEPKPQKRSNQSTAANLAPLPSFAGNFSGISLNQPNFMNDEGVSDSLLGDLENVVMTEGAVDTPPVPQNVSVPYPERAKQRDLEGTVLVSVQVNEKGQVTNVQILEASPPGVFNEAVLEASKDWTFLPARYEGSDVSTWVNIPIPFRLN